MKVRYFQGFASLSVCPDVSECLPSREVLELQAQLRTADRLLRGEVPGLGLQGNVLRASHGDVVFIPILP